MTVDRNSFYRKPENGHYRTFYRKFGERAAEEKLAEILAREETPVLATLSTSIPSMNTHLFSGFRHNLVTVQPSTGSYRTFYRKFFIFTRNIL